MLNLKESHNIQKFMRSSDEDYETITMYPDFVQAAEEKEFSEDAGLFNLCCPSS